jgi:hypothetical protein
VKVAAPLAELPLFARAGTMLPLLPPDVDTLTGYGRARGLVHLRDRSRRLRLLAFPRGRSRASGADVRSVEGPGVWKLVVRSRRARRVSLEASLATLERPFRPCSVRLGRRALPRRAWSYSRRSRVLRVSFKARSATLAVRRACG